MPESALNKDSHNLFVDRRKPAADTARTEQKRDNMVAELGVKRPYVLFSRHAGKAEHLKGKPFPEFPSRFNEMVVYPQIQDALMLVVPIEKCTNTTAEINNLRYQSVLEKWQIYVPRETIVEFRERHEQNLLDAVALLEQ
jgi:magnesium-dependent phosphatase 1